MNIFVKMFDNRLEVESPGGFPPLVTSENIYEMHKPRNPHLMDAMFYLDFVKCAHEGTRRIRDSMVALNLPNPEFAEKRQATPVVRVTLRNDVSHRKVWIDKDASDLVGVLLWKKLTDDERRIINFIAEHGAMSVSQVQHLTDKSWPASSKILQELESKGIVIDRRTRVGRDPGCRWVLASAKE